VFGFISCFQPVTSGDNHLLQRYPVRHVGLERDLLRDLIC
jgi:hypothetical protein